MSLASVCVDRARTVVKEPVAARVEGRSQMRSVTGQWFKCRLFLQNTTDVADPEASRWLSQSTPQLLCLARDLDGHPLTLRGDYHIDVRSRELGSAIWEMAGEPEPMRKKRRVLGYVADLSRVIEREFDDLLLEHPPGWQELGPPGV